jgi:hypothetical protein
MAVRASENINPGNQFERMLRLTSKRDPSKTAASMASTGDHIVSPAHVIERIEAISNRIGSFQRLIQVGSGVEDLRVGSRGPIVSGSDEE